MSLFLYYIQISLFFIYMGWFSRKEKRSNDDTNIKNPCPIPQPDNANPMALSNLLRLFKGNEMNLSAFFAGLNLIANTIATIKLSFKDSEDKLLKPTHYLWHLFDDSAITKFNMFRNVIKDVIIKGNGFIYIERDQETGRPYRLHYSPASQTVMYYNPLNNMAFYMNPLYSSKWDNGDNYIHIYINSDDGFIGQSISTYAYKTIELASATEKTANDYYKSGSQLFGLISTNNTQPQVGTREQQMKSLRQSWDEARSQSNGTGTIFVPQDLKYTPLSSNAKDSALIESRLYNVQEIGRWLQISPFLLGDLSHNSYGSLSESQMAFLLYTLNPYIVALEEELNKKLIMPSKYGIEKVDLDENTILAIDKDKQANYLTNLTKNGIITINEARKVLGLSQVEDGDKLIIPYTDIESNTIAQTDEE